MRGRPLKRGRQLKLVYAVLAAGAVAGLLLGLTAAPGRSHSARARSEFGVDGGTHTQRVSMRGIHKIRHVVIIMQENRSFDSYFGTYPGADGIPGLAGNPGAFPASRPAASALRQPFHDRANQQSGGPHAHVDAIADINGGKMDGFVVQAQTRLAQYCRRTPFHRRTARTSEAAGRDGLSRPARDPELLGVCTATSSCRTTCSSRTRRGACRRTSSSSPAGRRLCTKKGDPMSCTAAVQSSRPAARNAREHNRQDRRTTPGQI